MKESNRDLNVLLIVNCFISQSWSQRIVILAIFFIQVDYFYTRNVKKIYDIRFIFT